MDPIVVPITADAKKVCKSYIEAGYLTGRTMHRGTGRNQVVKILGKLKNLPNETFAISDRDNLDKEKLKHVPTNVYIENMSGILSFGDQNIIAQEQHAELSQLLKDLMKKVQESSDLTLDQKKEAKASIITVEAQLANPKLDKEIIKRAYDGMKFLATIEGCADLVIKVSPLIISLLT